MLDELLSQIPPVLVDNSTGMVHYLTLTFQSDRTWATGYVDADGEPNYRWSGVGVTPVEAVKDLWRSIRLDNLLTAPAIKVNEVTGEATA